jgi:hypothetical protein
MGPNKIELGWVEKRNKRKKFEISMKSIQKSIHKKNKIINK